MPTLDTRRARSSPPPSSVPAELARALHIGADAFVSEIAVEALVRGGAATHAGSVLTLGDGRRFALRDAVRVLGRRNGDTDPYGFTGRVEALRELVRRGATLSADALRLGPAVYDIEYGYLAAPCDVAPRAA